MADIDITLNKNTLLLGLLVVFATLLVFNALQTTNLAGKVTAEIA